MKKLFLAALLSVLASGPSHADVVYCTNCSDKVMQAVEKATSLEQLKTLLKEYDEAVTQTASQLQIVQQNIQQYANMVQNTKHILCLHALGQGKKRK